MESDDKMSKRKSKTDVQEPKYDIRNWTRDGEPGKGVTMNLEELRTLYELIGKELDYIDHRL